ncbi:hypothetical protein HPP92_026592 [Vanilla planifolia]|uniref:Uncharacterized protein n=1 Tax=Vanilla planifolia TaxID=51239 RepID=A0A835PI37_VANPL|nr:hypothetical protein HPP92_026592 [Vanilla planifolia]
MRESVQDGPTMEVMRHASTFLLPSRAAGDLPESVHALVVLNQRLPSFTPLLWQRAMGNDSRSFCRTAKLRLCADGGANRLFDELPEMFPEEDPAEVRSRFV